LLATHNSGETFASLKYRFVTGALVECRTGYREVAVSNVRDYCIPTPTQCAIPPG